MGKTFIEKVAQRLRIIPNLNRLDAEGANGPLRAYPDPNEWHDHVELDANEWPKMVEKRYSLVPTTCFNCESACGLLAYVDKDTGQVSKFEGNPHHPREQRQELCQGPCHN